MERQLFDWIDWDAESDARYTFYNITLKVDMDEFKVGTAFESAFVDYQDGKVTFYNLDRTMNLKEVATFKLHLTFERA